METILLFALVIIAAVVALFFTILMIGKYYWGPNGKPPEVKPRKPR